jgi:hypothetical protein
MSNSVAATAPWVADFCQDYTPFLLTAGKLTLIAGIILGIALACAAILAEFRKKQGGAGNLVAPGASVLDAVKGFIQALSSAPTWLALFGGGILLLWLAGNSVPEICKPTPPAQTQPAPQGQGATTPAETATTTPERPSR